jgi:hypothetical protein
LRFTESAHIFAVGTSAFAAERSEPGDSPSG